MSEISVREENVWHYYEKVSALDVKCRFCGRKYYYNKLRKFQLHITEMHSEIATYEQSKGRQEWPWIFYKYINASTLRCIFCPTDFQHDFRSLARHLRQEHFNQVKNFVVYPWIWKYYEKMNNLICSITDCFYRQNISLNPYLEKHIVTQHSEELINAQETCGIVLSSQSIRKLEVEENVWEYYNKLSSVRVTCNYCIFECSYIDTLNNCSDHLSKQHNNIFVWEDMCKNEVCLSKCWSKCFKYSYDNISNILYSECFICREFLMMDSEETHLSEKHSEEQQRDFISNTDSWIIKYFKKSNNTTEFKCTICCQMVTININYEMSIHTIESHPEVLLLKLLSKAMQKLRIRKLLQNYTLNNFQAKCKLCDFESCYIYTTNFSEHVRKEHLAIYNYERIRQDIYPWKYFMYFTSNCVQCHICNDTVSCINVSLENHLANHTLHESFDINNWIWKYCTKNSEFEVQCNICRRKILLKIPSLDFDRHIQNKHSNRLIRIQRMYDIAGPSGSQPN